ncbi:MAG: hypothetical protein J7513_17915 [Solirubrobacteraceae bacterium]|nr:hypothetical protein [Solirubrobacteraceae bacterium]
MRWSTIDLGAVGRKVEGAIPTIGLGLLVAIQVPYVDTALTALNIRESPSFTTTVGALSLIALLAGQRRLDRVLTSANADRAQLLDADETYRMLKVRAAAVKRKSDKQLDILGLTLFSAWPQLQFFLERDATREWNIRIATLSPDADLATVPSGWLEESASNARQIAEFNARHADNELDVAFYSFQPGLHGFRLGNGDLFIAFIRWDGTELSKKGFQYQYLPAERTDKLAVALRDGFDNWFTQARAGVAKQQAVNSV